MSKAFTKESDSGDDDDDVALPALPQGTKNYLTPQGYARLRSELMGLLDEERPKVVEVVSWAAKNGVFCILTGVKAVFFCHDPHQALFLQPFCHPWRLLATDDDG